MHKTMWLAMAVDISEGSDYKPSIVAIENDEIVAISKAISYLKKEASRWNLNPADACDFDNMRVADETGTKGCQICIQSVKMNVELKIAI